eukprot:1019291-Pyramimonas_sp.AAC.1
MCKSFTDRGRFLLRCGSPCHAAQIRLKSLHQFPEFSGLPSQEWCFGSMSDCQGAAVNSIRGVQVPGLVLWHNSGSSRRNSS